MSEIISNSAAESLYTNEMTTEKDFGGIKAGTSFSNVPIKDIITMLLYPYVDIKFGTVSANNTPKTYYVGSLPTLKSVTLQIKKNYATELSFSLYDVTDESNPKPI
jgi:hypothetical protein